MAAPSQPLTTKASIPVQQEGRPVPPIRWVIVGYFFWVGIFLGAVIMRAATNY